jgi:hypothetical protein
MIIFSPDNRLYIGATSPVSYVISGKNNGVGTILAQGNVQSTQFVLRGQYNTEIELITISNTGASSTVEVFIDGIQLSDRIYTGVLQTGYTLTFNESGWIIYNELGIQISTSTGGSDATAANQLAGNSSLTTIAGAITANRMQVDVITSPSGGSGLTDVELRATPVPVSGSLIVTGTNLDTRDLTFASDKVDVSGSTITIQEPLSIDDNGSSITVDGPLTDSELRAVPVPISGTVVSNAGTNLNTSALALEATLQSVKTAVELIDNTVSGSELQVDIVSLPTVTVQSTNLDTRDLTFVDDKVDASGTVLGTGSNTIGKLAANSGIDIGDVTINNSSGGSAVNIQDGGNVISIDDNGSSITIDGIVVLDSSSTVRIADIGSNELTIAIDGVTDVQNGIVILGRDGVTGKDEKISSTQLTNSTSMFVAIADSNGDQITSFGGGTQYDEGDTDATITGSAILWEDAADTLATVSASTPLPVNIVAGSSSGTEYTQGNTDATITGIAVLMEVAGDTLQPIQGTVADGLLVNLGSNNDVTVTGSVTANAGTNLNTSSLALEATLQSVKTAVEIIDNAVSGSEFQVDVLTMPTTTVQATNLDIRDLTFAADKVDASGTVLGASTNNIGDVDVLTLPAITGTVTANAGTNLNTSTLALESGGNLASAVTALQIIDDWDETDRAKVNPIVGQAGVQGGAGSVTASTQRVTLARTATAYCYNIPSQVHVAGANTVHWDMFNADATVIVRVLSIRQIPNITTAVTGVVFDWLLERTTAVGTGGSTLTAWLADTSDTVLDADITARSKPTGGATQSTDLFNYSISSEETNTATITVASQGGLELVPPHLLPDYGGKGIVLRQNQGLRCVQVTNSNAGNTGWLISFITE